MKLFRLAAMLVVALALLGCGGGTSSTAPDVVRKPVPPAPPDPAPLAVSLDAYLPQLMAGRWHGILSSPAGAFSTEFFSEPGKMRWGTSVEHWRVRDCAGHSYAWVDGYESTTAKAFYPVTAVLDKVDGVDLSACADGTAFAPLHMTPRATPLVTEQWFKIWDETRTYWRPGYWHAEFRILPAVANPCEAGATAPAVELREVWWDSAAGWVRGRPVKPGTLPWEGDNSNPVDWKAGSPMPVQVASDSVETFALHAGLWTITEGGGEICQASLTTW